MTAEHISSALTYIGSAFANHIWQSTVFAAVVGVLTMLLRRYQARIRFALWLVASIKFLLPFSLLIGLGGLLPKPQHVAAGSQAGLYAAIDAAGQPFSVGSAAPIGSAVHAGSLLQQLTMQLPLVAAGVWFFGACVVLLVWFARWRQVSAILRRTSQMQHGREVSLLRRLQEATCGHRRMELRLSPERMEPGVFGIVRPVLIWPERLSERLDEEQMEAILAHEMTHERRHDNLSAAIHMLVEVLFWFHPMVWWMERRMVEERERACDEAVVRLGSSREAYADGLLTACRFCVEAPLACVSGITGADLSRRVRSIMTLGLGRQLGLKGKVLLAIVAAMVIAVPVTFGVVHAAQSSSANTVVGDKPLRFAVVSIRQNKTGGQQRFGEATPDGYRMENMFLAAPIMTAYVPQIGGAAHYSDDEIVGLPAWLESDNDHYDINAKVDEADLADWRNPAKQPAMLRAMLQAMLADRLKLVVRHRMKEASVYLLVVGKSGPKFKETNPDEPHPGAYPFPGGGKLSMERKDDMVTTHYFGITIGQLASSLPARRPVQNKTGLAGKYDITIQEPVPVRSVSGMQQGPASDPDIEMSASSIAKQLGLELEPAKGQVETLVIDHVERPSAN